MKKFLCLIVLFAFPLTAVAQPANAPEFIRIVKEGKKVVALETAITEYRLDKDTTVTLVGVVHIADRDYYHALQRRLDKFDAVLYELVAHQGTRPAPKREGIDVYKIVGMVLDLSGQMQEINYNRKHFVHADLSPSEIMAEAKKRGDTGLTIGLSVAADMLRKHNLNSAKPQPPVPDIDIKEALINPNILKRQMAMQLAASADLGPTLDTLLVKDRNARVLQVLDWQLKAGKRNIGIFYGAAHNPSFHKSFMSRGYTMSKQGWVTAWSMYQDNTDPNVRMLKVFMEFNR